MKIHYEHPLIPIQNPVVTVGFFDGVHNGHRALLNVVKKEAAAINGESVVVTLWPHPRMVLGGNTSDLQFLNTLDEKLHLLRETGINHVLVLSFNRDFALQSACDFVKNVLHTKLNARKFVLGYNNYIGHEREGNYERITSCCKPLGIDVVQYTEEKISESPVSSTIIRNYLNNGRVNVASCLLGYDYFIAGQVVKGNQLGRTIGFPTANIQPSDEHKLIPLEGVYAVTALIDGHLHKGMMNIGYRPTLNDLNPQKTAEVHLFNYNAELYGTKIMVNFIARLRDEQKFDNLEALQHQLEQDKIQALSILNH